MDVYPEGYLVGEVHPTNFDDYGYLDPFGFYVDVPLWFKSDIPPANQYMLVTVDLAINRTMIKKQWYGEALMGYSIEATIPSGQYLYKKFHSGARFLIHNYYPINRSDMWTAYYSVSQQPADATLSYFLSMIKISGHYGIKQLSSSSRTPASIAKAVTGPLLCLKADPNFIWL